VPSSSYVFWLPPFVIFKLVLLIHKYIYHQIINWFFFFFFVLNLNDEDEDKRSFFHLDWNWQCWFFPLSMILQLDFRNVPVAWHILFFYFISCFQTAKKRHTHTYIYIMININWFLFISFVHLTKISIMEGVKISVKMSFSRSYDLWSF
jgi:hypothetical protein